MFNFALASDWVLLDLLQQMPSLTNLVFWQIKDTTRLEKVVEMLGKIQSSRNDPSLHGTILFCHRFYPTLRLVNIWVHLASQRWSAQPFNILLPHAYNAIQLLSSPSRRIRDHFIPLFLGLMAQGLTVKVWFRGSEDILQSTIDYYRDGETPSRSLFFLELRERGVTVNVWSQLEDILQSSVDHYKGEEESLLPMD